MCVAPCHSVMNIVGHNLSSFKVQDRFVPVYLIANNFLLKYVGMRSNTNNSLIDEYNLFDHEIESISMFEKETK